MSKIYVANIVYESLVDGYGLRDALFLSGCNINCNNCHNKDFKDIAAGKEWEVADLASFLRKQSVTKRLTISGGEPLEQKEALTELIGLLDGFDIGLYTGKELNEIDLNLSCFSFVKTGRYIDKLRCYNKFYGSSNQSITIINNRKHIW